LSAIVAALMLRHALGHPRLHPGVPFLFLPLRHRARSHRALPHASALTGMSMGRSRECEAQCCEDTQSGVSCSCHLRLRVVVEKASSLKQAGVTGECHGSPVLYRTLAVFAADTLRYKLFAPAAAAAV
jgi:hypothetical protein